MNNTIQQYKDYVMTGFVKAVQPIVVEKAQGAIITDTDGKDYIDCFAGISVVNSGHCNPLVVEAAKAQLDKLIHCGSYIYHNQPMATLAEKLAALTPGKLKKSFFCNSGAEAIEGALRLARLYTGKQEFIALQTGFHGRTWGALSITGNAGRKRGGSPFATGVTFVQAPYHYRARTALPPEEFANECARSLRDTLRFSTAMDVAAMVVEPVLGEGGIIVPPLNYFKAIKEVLDEHNILLIVDEVQSGFGRTGKMFAIEHYGVEPDMLVTAKGIAAGFPLGAFTTRDEIAEVFRPGDHLSTFGGNPVACAAALANIEFIEQTNLCEQVGEKENYVLAKLRDLQTRFPLIGEVRGKGLMIGLELVKDAALTPAAAEAERLRESCLKKGVLVGVGGAFGNVLRLQPPLVISHEQLDRAVNALEESFIELK
ncbi:MAG: aspartate aminotransferase family protein [Acidobacteria bacterium]|nr:aspartate aminotransferase family protein [Acidobacteriota bacterium]